MVSQMDRACFLIFGGGHLRRHYMRVIDSGGYEVVFTHGLLLNRHVLVGKPWKRGEHGNAGGDASYSFPGRSTRLIKDASVPFARKL